MFLLPVLIALEAAAPALPPAPYPSPSAEAEALGRRLAEAGTLAALLPMIAAKETDELVADHPELSAADRATLRDTARDVFAKGRERLLAATGHSYATRLSPADLKAAAAWAETPSAKAVRAATPIAIIETMGTAGEIDFKGDVLKAFCAKTGKACPAPARK